MHTALAATRPPPPQDSLGQLFLGRSLLLVLLLDRMASRPDLPGRVPPLFRHDAPLKRSAQVAGQTCRTGGGGGDEGEGEEPQRRGVGAVGIAVPFGSRSKQN